VTQTYLYSIQYMKIASVLNSEFLLGPTILN